MSLSYLSDKVEREKEQKFLNKLALVILFVLFGFFIFGMTVDFSRGKPLTKLEEDTIYLTLSEFKPAPISPDHFLVVLASEGPDHKYYKLEKNRLFNKWGELINDIPTKFMARKVEFERKGYEIIPVD